MSSPTVSLSPLPSVARSKSFTVRMRARAVGRRIESSIPEEDEPDSPVDAKPFPLSPVLLGLLGMGKRTPPSIKIPETRYERLASLESRGSSSSSTALPYRSGSEKHDTSPRSASSVSSRDKSLPPSPRELLRGQDHKQLPELGDFGGAFTISTGELNDLDWSSPPLSSTVVLIPASEEGDVLEDDRPGSACVPYNIDRYLLPSPALSSPLSQLSASSQNSFDSLSSLFATSPPSSSSSTSISAISSSVSSSSLFITALPLSTVQQVLPPERLLEILGSFMERKDEGQAELKIVIDDLNELPLEIARLEHESLQATTTLSKHFTTRDLLLRSSPLPESLVPLLRSIDLLHDQISTLYLQISQIKSLLDEHFRACTILCLGKLNGGYRRGLERIGNLEREVQRLSEGASLREEKIEREKSVIGREKNHPRSMTTVLSPIVKAASPRSPRHRSTSRSPPRSSPSPRSSTGKKFSTEDFARVIGGDCWVQSGAGCDTKTPGIMVNDERLESGGGKGEESLSRGRDQSGRDQVRLSTMDVCAYVDSLIHPITLARRD